MVENDTNSGGGGLGKDGAFIWESVVMKYLEMSISKNITASI